MSQSPKVSRLKTQIKSALRKTVPSIVKEENFDVMAGFQDGRIITETHSKGKSTRFIIEPGYAGGKASVTTVRLDTIRGLGSTVLNRKVGISSLAAAIQHVASAAKEIHSSTRTRNQSEAVRKGWRTRKRTPKGKKR